MNFDLDDQQRALQGSIGKFLTNVGEKALERVIRDGYAFDQAAWQRLAEQIGVQGLAIAEDNGGSEAGATEVVLAIEELGKGCYPSPYVSTAIATATLNRRAAQAPELLAAVADGSAIPVLAISDDGGDWFGRDYTTTASDSAVTGRKQLVRDAATATHFLVAATRDGAPSLQLVAADAAGVKAEADNGMDPGSEIGRVTFEDAEAVEIAHGAEAAELLDRAAADASLYLAAECLGLAAGALRRSVDWALQREQFGRPIGVHQSIKHMCADALMEVEAARVLVYYASTQVDEDVATYALTASHAKSQAAAAARTATADLVQILGGIGFTWEHPAHLYFKRARVNGILAGTTTDHLDRIADAVLPAKG